jgi:hypothetical protein
VTRDPGSPLTAAFLDTRNKTSGIRKQCYIKRCGARHELAGRDQLQVMVDEMTGVVSVGRR